METAKVDLRKLQALNDRINQCIDALNQVRLSVHGLSHSTGQSPYAQAGVNPLAQAYISGFSHTSPVMGAIPGFAPGVTQGFSPFQGASPFQTQGFGPFQGVSPFSGLSPFQGLSHTSPEEAFGRPAWSDPLLAARIAQTFPYAQYSVPPVVTIY